MFYTADSLRQMHQGGETVDFLFFYGHQLPSDGSATESCLSQWYPCIFEADGILYQSMEQYMMYQKAVLFRDIEMAGTKFAWIFIDASACCTEIAGHEFYPAGLLFF